MCDKVTADQNGENLKIKWEPQFPHISYFFIFQINVRYMQNKTNVINAQSVHSWRKGMHVRNRKNDYKSVS